MGDDATRLGRPVLLDNTVLTNFALVGRSDLVMRLWPSGACTTFCPGRIRGCRNQGVTASQRLD